MISHVQSRGPTKCSSVYGIFQVRILTWKVGYHFSLQGIFLTLGSNPCLLSLLCLLHWQVESLPLLAPEKPISSKLYIIGSDGKKKTSACNAGDLVQSLDQEDPLEKGTATHSSILAWRIPWAEEPDRL